MATLTTSYQKLGEAYLGTDNYGAKMYVRVYAKYSDQDITLNKTKVQYQARAYFDKNWDIYDRQSNGTVGGTGVTTQSFTKSDSYYGGETTLGTAEGWVEHESNGSKTITATATLNLPNWGWSGTASGSADLPTIPRASEISSVSTVNIGSSATITVNRKSSSYTHSITYSFGNLSGTVVTKSSNTSISWTIPTSFYAQIPNAKTGSGTLTITTYSGNTQIGSSSTKSFSVTTSESSCKPTVTGSVVDSNSTTLAVTGNSSVLIAGYSTASVSYSATPKNSASIKTITVNNVSAYSGTSSSAVSGTKTISNFNASSINIVAKDSRTYSNTRTLTAGTNYTLVNYIPLTFNGSVSRQTPTGDVLLLSFSGKYFNGNLGATTNTLTISWKWRVKGTSSWANGGTLVQGTDYTINTSNNTYSGNNINLGNDFDYRNNYEIGVFYNDALVNTSVVLEGRKGTPIVNWGEDYFNVNGLTIIEDIKCRNMLTITETSSTARGITMSVSNGEITTTGTFSGTETTFVFGARASLKGGTTYTLSTNNSAGALYPYLLLYDRDNNQIARLATREGILTFTPSSDVEVNKIGLYINNSSGVGITIKPQLEEGNGKTDFVVGKNYGFMSGSNDNGRYIKYYDGTMICWNTIRVEDAFTTALGPFYYNGKSTDVVFPIEFYNIPTISLSCQNQIRACYLGSSNKTGFGAVAMTYSSQNAIGYLFYIAIGRWK